MSDQITQAKAAPQKSGLGAMQVLGIVLLTVILTVGVTYWALNSYLFSREFKAVELSNKEEQVLDQKLEALGFDLDITNGDRQRGGVSRSEFDDDGRLRPEKYSEAGAARDVAFSERELNALLASNSELASRMAIDLSADLMSAKLLIPVDPEFPVLGGKTLRVNAGIELAYQDGRPIAILRGVSLWGVPVPNAWLGNLKNIDLVAEFGADQGFWKAFADGVDNIQVEDGRLKVKLKE